MRIYEFSRQVGLPNKEVLDLLRGAGFKISSHMSVLDEKCIEFLNKQRLGAKTPMETSVAAKQVKITPIINEKSQIVPQEIGGDKNIEKNRPARGSRGNAFQAKRSEDASSNKPVIYAEAMTAGELAEGLSKPLAEIIVMLLRQGVSCNKNQLLSLSVVEKVAEHYGVVLPKRTSTQDATVKENNAALAVHEQNQVHDRQPVLVVIGHVDHGKTTLLDYIRKTRVVAREKGGITQHVGAYQVATKHGKMTFLDTPGHEAFSMIRVRGIRVADIAILVVAADDGVMPQTIEAIQRAQEMSIPIVVAINKVDRVDLDRVEEVKAELSRHGLLADDWGGQTICLPISAKTGKGVEELLEYVAIYAQDLSLKTNHEAVASGAVIDARVERGRGPVATVIIRQGILKTGDYFVCGAVVGRVNSLISSNGDVLSSIAASIPVVVVGFSALPQVGDSLKVVSFEEYRDSRDKKNEATHSAAVKYAQQQSDTINIVIKADSDASREAVVNAIVQMRPVGSRHLKVVSAAVGNINESDIELANTVKAVIYGFGIKTDINAQMSAKELGVVIKNFYIIYQLLDEIALYAKSKQEIVVERKKVGEAEVLKIFDIKGVGVIAGCVVRSGKFVRDGYAIAWRGKTKVGEGLIKSLQRDKKNAKEINTGFECAFLIEGFADWSVSDRVECYTQQPVQAS